MKKVTLKEIQKAHQELSQFLAPTPMIKNDWLSEHLGCELFLKLENMQPIGSFKIRGATYKIKNLTDAEKKKGVIAASAGNHAQGVAWGSRKYGVDAMIVMPKNAPLMKIRNTQTLGAHIKLEGEHYQEAYQAAVKIAEEENRVFVHAYEDADVIAGQGGVGLEMVEQCPEMDYAFIPMGGGGLMAGSAIAIKALSPKTKIIGCQASGASSLAQSLQKGKVISLNEAVTFADGIATSKASSEMVDIIKPNVDEVVMMDDPDIARSVLLLLEEAKTVAEGSGAVALASAEKLKNKLKGKKVVCVVSGGNIDLNLLNRITEGGLSESGRVADLRIIVPDRPGSLMRLTNLLAKHQVNILQTIHERNSLGMRIFETEILVTIETKGKEHLNEVVQSLKEQDVIIEVEDVSK